MKTIAKEERGKCRRRTRFEIIMIWLVSSEINGMRTTISMKLCVWVYDVTEILNNEQHLLKL